MRKALLFSTVLYAAAVAVAAVGIKVWLSRVDAYLEPHEDASLYGLAYIVCFVTAAFGLLPLVLTTAAWLVRSLKRRTLMIFATVALATQLSAGAFYVYMMSVGMGEADHLLAPWFYGASALHLVAGALILLGARQTPVESRAPLT